MVNEHGDTVALDLALTPELLRAGLAREAIRLVQEARKTTGLDVSDRIVLRWHATGATAEALREHSTMVAAEVLATTIEEADEPATGWVNDADLELAFAVSRAEQG